MHLYSLWPWEQRRRVGYDPIDYPLELGLITSCKEQLGASSVKGRSSRYADT